MRTLTFIGARTRTSPHPWATIPSTQWLSMARHWHFFFAWLFVLNGAAYIAYAISSGHLRRDMIPSMQELRNIGSSIIDHIKFKHPTGEATKRYNVLKNLVYLAVIFGLLPLVLIAGWALSPRLDVIWSGSKFYNEKYRQKQQKAPHINKNLSNAQGMMLHRHQ